MTDDPEFVKLFFAFAHSFKNENDLDVRNSFRILPGNIR